MKENIVKLYFKVILGKKDQVYPEITLIFEWRSFSKWREYSPPSENDNIVGIDQFLGKDWC